MDSATESAERRPHWFVRATHGDAGGQAPNFLEKAFGVTTHKAETQISLGRCS